MALETALEALKQVLSFEKKKAVLPTLFCLVIVIGLISGYSVRAEGYDGQLASQSLEMSTEMQVLHALNESSGNITNEDINEVGREYNAEARNIRNKLPMQIAGASLVFIYRSEFYPVVPAGAIFNQDDKSLLFSSSNGYVFSKEYIDTTLLIGYRAEKIAELSEKLISENIMSEDFRQELDNIKSVEASDPEVVEFYKNGGPNRGGSVANIGGILNQDAIFDTQEVQWYHFTPALLVTFTLYYLVNAALVELFRNIFYLYRGYKLSHHTETSTY